MTDLAETPERPKKSAKTIVIGLSGPSSSGKTTLARLLRTIFAVDNRVRTFIIHEDDFYHSDDKIPVTTTAKGELVQDWDTIGAIDVNFLASALAYVREHGTLPPRLQSKEDQNEATDPGVTQAKIESISQSVQARLSNSQEYSKTAGSGTGEELPPLTVAILEGFLLYAPPASENPSHILRPVQENIDLPLFLPAPYDIVKQRREARSGYVTIGPAPTPLERPLGDNHQQHIAPSAVDLNEKDDAPPQDFWTDPPGYVDDIVWPRYVQDHAWLLIPEEDASSKESLADRYAKSTTQSDEELLRLAGKGVNMRNDAGVLVAPGQGEKPMTEILDWAVDEVLRYLQI
ncbi:P-loop containing nucleoside triphosphate hydrolase protein [Talaromyces proteolyticus]|uniref:P-loop containing nucleoside triphosphate hydrolase protein n=1 Tax=Talaromyces proteolyticus TaxID=1131652 RepID=A0AAD4KRI2_9EURO|nr:P-loop containing nucleoside triphosphate hydrolase protein [Talaromyces proteolyticus]KAH8697670.1 P-loop containing nucleoside triphosphate hydrolase protein [Talaromyces proteolyticus]